jgi:hypothetical protein
MKEDLSDIPRHTRLKANGLPGTLEAFVPSQATRQLGQRIDEELLTRIELFAFNQKRCKGRFRTVRSILEDAARMWLEKHDEASHRRRYDDDLVGADVDDLGGAW